MPAVKKSVTREVAIMVDGNGDLLTIGALARASGATPRAIRFYEGLGLVTSCRRSRAGYRLFEQRELDRLNVVAGLRKSGFSIKDIVRLFSIPDKSLTAKAAAGKLNGSLSGKAREVQATAEALKHLASDLERTADVLVACLDCDKAFDELDCGNCEPIRGIGAENIPTAFRAIWPMNGR